MRKRRITLSLDEDVVAALESVESPSVSAAANDALRDALELALHRQALARWLDELDARHGPPAEAEFARADALLDEARGLGEAEAGAA